MYIFLGPEPNQVVEQYTSAIGTFYLVPYWSLGFQLCRYGYNHIDTVKETVARMDKYQIPLVNLYFEVFSLRLVQVSIFYYDRVSVAN